MMKRALILLGLAALLAAGGAHLWLERLLHHPLALTSVPATLEVEPGTGLNVILARLKARGWLQHSLPISLWAKWQGLDRGLHVGEYALEPGITAKELLQKLNRGDVIRYAVTLPEGITLAEAIQRLQQAEGVVATLTGPRDRRLLELVAPRQSAEGWFLPETYSYTRGDTDYGILLRAHRLMVAALAEAWKRRDKGGPLTTPDEALILASIIERETSIPEERAAIAGVFTRRLERGMRLQTDPSVIYGLGERYSGNLTRAHLRDDGNPWNTYRIPGLPPTPIALPGGDALVAAVQPAGGEALYFVAQGDGYHAFAATLEEHNANVKRYQLSRRENYRSTPGRRSD